MTVCVSVGAAGLGSAVPDFALGDFATASAAAPGHATVGNGHGVVAQHIQQILSALDVQSQVVRLHHEFHGMSVGVGIPGLWAAQRYK